MERREQKLMNKFVAVFMSFLMLFLDVNMFHVRAEENCAASVSNNKTIPTTIRNKLLIRSLYSDVVFNLFK